MMENLSVKVGAAYEELNFYQGCVHIMSLLRLTNQFVQEQQPWKLKEESDRDKLHWILSTSFESLRLSGIMLQPVVQHLASSLLDKLSVGADQRHWSMATPGQGGVTRNISPDKIMLFRKIRS